ncbi:MAG TPA: DinB family protein [Chitinophagaceae bacterium]|nr:DinB family protein [Chitinophagaceae bacterium]
MANTNKLPEVWLRGPLPDFLPALQPVAHALLQAQEEMNQLLETFPSSQLWQGPGNIASVGFHLQHMRGVLDRLFTYAAAKGLSSQQLEYLAAEEKAPSADTSTDDLLQLFNQQVGHSLTLLKNMEATSLFEHRNVGRANLPSTVFGLVVHAAEHTMRHLGQLLVTVQWLKQLPA